MPMPAAELPRTPHGMPPAAEVRVAEAASMPPVLIRTARSAESPRAAQPFVEANFPAASLERPATRDLYRVSNAPRDVQIKIVCINGIDTSREEAEKARLLMARTLGTKVGDITLLYNDPESTRTAGVMKVASGILSRRLGERTEPKCVNELRGIVRETLETEKARLIVAAHSQGSLIFQNAIDGLYDEYRARPDGVALWMKQSARIDGIFYAPVVCQMVPGPRVVGFSNSLDIPARGASGLSQCITYGKSVSGWRPYRAVDSVVFSPEANRFPDVLMDPGRVHCSVDLILTDAQFNMRLLGYNRQTGRIDGGVLAGQLVQSIREGRRSDYIHFEIMHAGIAQCGAPFARPFLAGIERSERNESGRISDFEFEHEHLEILERAAAWENTRH